MKILVLVDDREFGQELRNFLLSAGCSEVALAAELDESTPLDFELVVADDCAGAHEELLRRLCRRQPTVELVLLVEPGSELPRLESFPRDVRICYGLRSRFAQNIRSLLSLKDE